MKKIILVLATTMGVLLWSGCTKNGESDDKSPASAPSSIMGKSLISKNNGFYNPTYTFKPDGTVDITSVESTILNSKFTNTFYLYTPIGEGNATLNIKYTESYKAGMITSKYNVDYQILMTFTEGNYGLYSGQETSTVPTSKKKSGAFLLGSPGDKLPDDGTTPPNNCAARQYIYNSMKRNLESVERLRNNPNTSTAIKISCGAQIARIKQDMNKAKSDAKKAGCTIN
ncbi:MAG: hypothetical protein RSB32_04785 [Mucinivorans sp.]